MRRSTAIGLVVLGGGVIATAVAVNRNCRDPLTGQPIACPSNGSGGSGGSRGWTFGSTGTSSSSTTASVARGGFGGTGAAASAGS